MTNVDQPRLPPQQHSINYHLIVKSVLIKVLRDNQINIIAQLSLNLILGMGLPYFETQHPPQPPTTKPGPRKSITGYTC